jgi:hypothetical protein
LITPGAEEVWCRLMEVQKYPSVVGCKELQEGEGISMVEEARVEACGGTWCSWKQGNMKHG